MKQIIIRPVITEKSMSKTADGKYVFVVHSSCNKIEIMNEVKKAYKVEAVAVNILKVKGKERRFRGRVSGRTKDWKKAIITLKKGQKIEGFEVK